jgi:hypothetical protein
LHFSRQPGCGSYVTENLPLFRGMKSVLNHLAERAGDNNYKCVRPWKFLDYLNASQSPEDMRESIREQIAAALRREIY